MINKSDNGVHFKLSLSVGELVAYTCGTGSLTPGFISSGRDVIGIWGHQNLQSQKPEGYMAEETISHSFQHQEFLVDISGRIDGVYTANDPTIIEEIKTTEIELETLRLEPSPMHMAQLKCYGYLYALQHGLSKLGLRLTYMHLVSSEILEIDYQLTIETLKDFFYSLLLPYLKYEKDKLLRIEQRNNSIKSFSFPYGEFRAEQRSMAVKIFRVIRDKETLFIQAPTGTGKTIASLFPAIKSLGEGHTDRIFYLTARTVGRAVAEKALMDMREAGLEIKCVVLTAKDKICLLEERNCDPEICRYARNYYDKLFDSLTALLKEDHFNREILRDLGRKYELCPFELSLDLALSCDCIICDYNYIFDPRVYLKRFFDKSKESYTLLIDEAHNLPDRTRSMYSAQLSKNQLMELKRTIKNSYPKEANALQKINRLFLEEKKRCKDNKGGSLVLPEPPAEILKAIRSFVFVAESWLKKHRREPFRALFLEFYFECVNFIKMSELFSDNYIYYSELRGKSELIIKLYCIDPAQLVQKRLKKIRSAVFFSATLLPQVFFRRLILGVDNETEILTLPSPFSKKNLNIMIHRGITTTYRRREEAYAPIAELIEKVFLKRNGNTLVFFPSFFFMERVSECLTDRGNIKELNLQERKMDEPAREAFLRRFSEGQTPVLSTAVLGGIFGEGIDLVGEQLTSVIVVGVGLPQICLEREQIKRFFSETGGDGFAFAYRFPGFNRVMQAAGRLIRTSTDRGYLILVDERFGFSEYRKLFPPEWSHTVFFNSTKELLLRINHNNMVETR